MRESEIGSKAEEDCCDWAAWVCSPPALPRRLEAMLIPAGACSAGGTGSSDFEAVRGLKLKEWLSSGLAAGSGAGAGAGSAEGGGAKVSGEEGVWAMLPWPIRAESSG